jgi:DNA polymerase I-like protein with 3'-5' exonuclease and polymerase domains
MSKPPVSTTVYAIDTETYYDKDYSITSLGPTAYCRHPKFECYLITVAGSDGLRFAGSPKDAPWDDLLAGGVEWVMHNARFDLEVLAALNVGRDGIELSPFACPTHDTADLAAYLGYPRNLADAAKHLLGEEVDKGIRNVEMKGVRWADMDPELQTRVKEYGLRDAELTLRLWLEHGHKMPEAERLASMLSRKSAMHGLPVDVDRIEQGISHLKQFLWKARTNIPWEDPPLSPLKLALKCREEGIRCPVSLAMDDEDCAAWEEEYGERYPWVGSMRDFRRGNMLLKKLETMRTRTVEGKNDRLPYEVKFFGAHTGRWSGSGGFNPQNLNAKQALVEKFNVDLRACITAGRGNTLVIADLEQIEPRCIAWLTNDTVALQAMASGESPYIAHARATMGLAEGETLDKAGSTYKLAKARCLGLSYGSGHKKFLWMAETLFGLGDTFDEVDATPANLAAYVEYLERIGDKDQLALLRDPTVDDNLKRRHLVSWMVVDDYRRNSPKTTALWAKLGDGLRQSADQGHDFTVGLPSGRELLYRKTRYTPSEDGKGSDITVQIVKNGKLTRERTWGAKLTENLVQATARDVFRDCLINVADAGYCIVLHVHDELVVEVPEDKAEDALADIRAIMGRSVPWAPGLPVAAEGKISKTYTK